MTYSSGYVVIEMHGELGNGANLNLSIIIEVGNISHLIDMFKGWSGFQASRKGKLVFYHVGCFKL